MGNMATYLWASKPCRTATEHNSFIGNLADWLPLSFPLLSPSPFLAPSHANGFRKRAPINNLPPSSVRPTQRPTKASTLFLARLAAHPRNDTARSLFLQKLRLNIKRSQLSSQWLKCFGNAPSSIESFSRVSFFLKSSHQKMSGARSFGRSLPSLDLGGAPLVVKEEEKRGRRNAI